MRQIAKICVATVGDRKYHEINKNQMAIRVYFLRAGLYTFDREEACGYN